ncbi:hypothetical protein J5A52_00045 [TM7 phylum sp. oral taxon 349]|nr:hypothetical protein J5A52_00045 [TM7 phylum sp. oral taxon 349]
MPNEKYLNPSTISIPNSESFSILMGVVDSIGTGKYTKVFDSIELSGRKAILSDSIDSIGSIESIELVAKEDTPSDLIEPIELLDKEAMLSKIAGALGSLAVSWSEYRRLPDDTGSEAVGVSDKGDVVIAVFEDKGNTTISVVDSSFLGGDDDTNTDSSGYGDYSDYSDYGDDDDDGCSDDDDTSSDYGYGYDSGDSDAENDCGDDGDSDDCGDDGYAMRLF